MPTSTQFCYWSQTIGDGYASESDLREILEQSRANNERQGITGALLSGSGWFAQVLEGAPEDVHAASERIEHDARHHDVVKLPERTVNERAFPSWSMGFAMIGQSDEVELIRHHAVADRDEAATTATLKLIQESIAKFQMW